MAIPTIPAYPMPSIQDLPENKVNWIPDPKRAVLLIHDMQQYFLNAFQQDTSPITELVQHIEQLRDTCKELGIPVVYTAQPGDQDPKDRALLTDFWGPGLGDDEALTKIIDQLAPSEADIMLTKWRYSAFKKSNFLDILHEGGRDQLIITGVYAHIGCMLTAAEAFMLDIETFFVADAVADFSLKHHKMAMTYAAERCAVTTTTSQIISRLTGQEADGDDLSFDAIVHQVAEYIQIEPNEIPFDENLVYLGLDSIRMMSLAEKWRQQGATVNFVELAANPTLTHWRALLFPEKQPSIPNIDYL
ncbi:isochorismatase family protein [Bacillus pumilus]|uniref:isochorismatase family protein n=1 Tax=Bacillus pumilus TaxID=1408 RepID=UPI000F876860|nr:isochorismatase family protein [Bacillus pumilus]RST66275.1 isochorismatase family protein [Bacillus pumilus]